MSKNTNYEKHQWLKWAQKLQFAAQNGLTFTDDYYDRLRYNEVLEVAAEILASYSEAEFETIKQFFNREKGYLTPKVDVRGAVFKNDRILLVREVSDGLWTLPGGWADIHDSPAKNVEREIWEESGFETKATKLTMVYDRDLHGHPHVPYYVYKLFFLCEITGGAPKISVETSAVEFFEMDALPELSESRNTEAQIRRVFEHYKNPALPTDFD